MGGEYEDVIEDDDDSGDGLTLCVEVRWAEEEPDGSACDSCGDVAWSGHFRSGVFLNGEKIAFKGTILCPSCHDADASEPS